MVYLENYGHVEALTDILMHLSKTLRNIALLTFRRCNIIHFIVLVARSKHLCSYICVLAVVLCFKNCNKLASYGNGVIWLFWKGISCKFTSVSVLYWLVSQELIMVTCMIPFLMLVPDRWFYVQIFFVLNFQVLP